MTATAAVEPASTEGAPTFVKRVWAAPLWAHAAVLAALLLFVVMPLVGPYWQWSADEGATLFQAQQLADGDGWMTAPAFAEVDRDNEWFPIHLSSQADDGEWAAYAKLPLFPVVLAALLKLGGTTAVVSMSVLGTVVAAWASSRIAEDLRRGAGRATLWALALGTPMLFYSYSVIAHTVGAAAVAVGALGALRWLHRGSLSWLVGSCVATFVAVALRNEAVIAAAAAVVVLLAVGARSRDRRSWVCATVIAVSTVLVFGVNRLWARAIVGDGGIAAPSLNASERFLASRWDGFFQTMVNARGRDTLIVATLFLSATAVAVRLRRTSPVVPRVLAALTLLAGAVSIVVDGTSLVSGLLLVCPVLVGGAIVLRAGDLRGSAGGLIGCGLIFGIGVLLVQYGAGGTGEWGGRYFVIGLPLVIPVVVIALRRETFSPGGAVAVPLVVAVVGLAAMCSASAVGTLRASHSLTEQVVTTVVETAAGTDPGDGGPPVVVATTPAVARLAWRDVPDGRWMLVMEDDITDPVEITEAFARLDATDVDEVTVTVVPGYTLPEPAGWQLVEENLTVRGYGAAVFARER
jgi:hypothetical protein